MLKGENMNRRKLTLLEATAILSVDKPLEILDLVEKLNS